MTYEPKLRYKIFGIECGNFSPSLQTKEQFLTQTEKAKKLLGESVNAIFAPSVAFTNKLVEFGQNNDIFAPWLIRTKSKADAGMVEKSEIAIGFFNADCPIVCLQQDVRLVAIHGGYRCLIREDRNEAGILENAMQGFNPVKTKVFIFGGIGPCCWEPESDKPEIKNPRLCRYPELLVKCLKKTTRSPLGKNLPSVDLYLLTRLLLLKCGVSPKKISWNSRCTCCSCVQENGEPAYWSHTRFLAKGQNGIDGRNFTAVWIE